MLFRASAAILVVVATLFGQVRLDFMSAPPPPLRGYPGFWRQNNVQGQIQISAVFGSDGTVEGVTLASSRLQGRWNSSWGSLESEVFEAVSRQVTRWKTSISPIPRRRIKIEFDICKGLSERQQQYTVTYDEYGIPTHIIVAAGPERRIEQQ